MDLEPVRIELERQQTWRQNEIRFLKNQLANIPDESDKKRYRKSLVVMLYSHYEGFFKFALLQYVSAINSSRLDSSKCTQTVAAASLWRHFAELETGKKKSRIFKKAPIDDHLHRFSRRIEFIERYESFVNSPVRLPEDVINTQSNLWPEAVQKNLYCVGLDHQVLKADDPIIMRLLTTRNSIAHGLEEDGIESADYELLEESVFRLMDKLMELILEAVKSERFIRN